MQVTHMVYEWAVTNGGFPRLDPFLYERYTRAWNIDQAKFESLSPFGWPNRTANLILSLEANKKFGELLDQARGFYRELGLGFVFDLSDRYAYKGCLIPFRDRAGLYIGMIAFRGCEDQRPFLIRTDEEREEPFEWMEVAAA